MNGADDAGRILSSDEKERIAAQAERAAAECFTRNEGCPYPFGDLEEKHWTACFLLKGGKL